MVSHVNTNPVNGGTTSCKSFDGGADKYVGGVVASKGWPSGIISGGKRHRKGRTARKGKGKGRTARKGKGKSTRRRSRKAGSCCKGGSQNKNGGGLASMLGRALVPFGLLAAQQRTPQKVHRRNKSYRKKSFRKRR